MEDLLYKDKLDELIKTTTAKNITDQKGNIIAGSDIFDAGTHPHELRNKHPSKYESLTPEWQTIWDSFGNTWSQERQWFRYFWEESQNFFQSYKLYRQYLTEFFPLVFDEDPTTKAQMLLLGLNSELSIRSMYEFGKQGIDILEKIDKTLIQGTEKVFCDKFSETRNKFLTHYHNPAHYPDFIFDPVYWSIMGTAQLLEVRIHLPQKEHFYTAYINHNNDYYSLERIFVEAIRKISEEKKINN